VLYCYFNIHAGLLVVEDNPWIEANNPYKKLPTVRTMLLHCFPSLLCDMLKCCHCSMHTLCSRLPLICSMFVAMHHSSVLKSTLRQILLLLHQRYVHTLHATFNMHINVCNVQVTLSLQLAHALPAAAFSSRARV
jgi:hypothetical protein